MIRDAPDGGPLQPATERVGSSGSARVAAMCALVLLAGIIWVGVAGRSKPPADTPPVAAVATGAARPTSSPPHASPSSTPTEPAIAVRPSPTPRAGPTEPPIDGTPLVVPRRHGPLGDDAFAVTVWLDNRFYMSVLHEDTPGHMAAAMRVPLYAEMPTTTLQLIQLWTRADRPPLAEIAAYELMLGDLLEEPAPEFLLNAETSARPRKARAPRLIREGYALTVRTDVRRDHAFLVFEVTVGDAQPRESTSQRLLRITRGWQDFGLRLADDNPVRAPVHPELVEWGVTR